MERKMLGELAVCASSVSSSFDYDTYTFFLTLFSILAFIIPRCVVTSPFSDWSISPTTSPGISYSNPKSTSDQWLYIQISTHSANSPDISIHAYQAESSSGKGRDSLPPKSRPRDENLVLIRECRGFNVLSTNEDGKKEDEKWSIGVMTCGPLTGDHTEGKFADFWLEYS